ncbi:MAG TPA: M13 family metallopeptidase [Allosphingosinicella sp.]|jgi:putative endopeptidase
MRFIFAAASALAVAAMAASAQAPRPAWGEFGIDTASMDTSVRPGDDFWSYVNGTWAKTVEIPADQGAFSQVSRLNKLAASQVRDILDEYAGRRSALKGDDLRVSDYYSSLMDQTAIDAGGIAPLAGELAPVRAARDRAALAAAIGDLTRSFLPTPALGRMPRYWPSPVVSAVTQDAKAPDTYAAYLGEGSTGLPNRDYFLKDDEASLKVTAAYRGHIANILRLAGVPAGEVDARAQAVFEFERAMAGVQWPLADRRDDDKTYNVWSRAELEARAPGFPWTAYLEAAGLGDRKRFIVGETSAVTGIAKLYAATPLPVLKDWVTLRLAKDRALVLPSGFAKEEFAFSFGVLRGTAAAPPRWDQAVELTAAAMTDAVSRPYIDRHFPPATKKAMDALVGNVIRAMDARLARLEWMEPATRAKARAKLAAFHPQVGYPATWLSYDGLEVRRGDAYGNLVRAGRWDWKRRLARIDRPVDRDEWWMMPITANAYASFANNAIVFPAAYLQAPHFDAAADPAVNYGAIGFVIGHEISHHFDDQGSKYSPDGRLEKWWTDGDLARFKERTARLAAQYGAYEPLPGLHIRSDQTLGEDIADNAGLAVAYDAYRLSLGGKPAPLLGGFTGDQRFFMGRAQVNKVRFRDAELRRIVLSDFHSPSRFRTFSVRNHDAWYEAFGVKPGDKLYLKPEDRVRIW